MNNYKEVFITQLTIEQLTEAVKLRAKELHPMMPETWTHLQNLATIEYMLRTGFKYKLMGLNWRSNEDFGHVFDGMLKAGIIQRDGMMIRRNPHYQF